MALQRSGVRTPLPPPFFRWCSFCVFLIFRCLMTLKAIFVAFVKQYRLVRLVNEVGLYLIVRPVAFFSGACCQ